MARPLLKWVYHTFNGVCHYCKIKTRLHAFSGDKNKATIDHKIPKSSGVGAGMENLLLACRDCNSRKGSKPYRVFLKEIRENKEQKQ